MPLRLKGSAPKAGESDRRYYMIDVQEGSRRVRLSTGTRDKHLALRKEQAVIDALRADPAISDADLRALVRGAQLAARAALARAKTGPTLKEACDAALADRNGWGRLTSHGSYATNCRMLQQAMGADLLIERIDQAAVDDLVDALEESGNTPTTINRKLFVLMAVLRREKKAGRYSRELPEFKNFNERDRRRTFVLTRDDEAALFDAVLALDQIPDQPVIGPPRKRDAHEYHDLFVFLVDVGCRLGQAFKVKWRDVVTEDGQTFIRFWRSGEQKGGRTRTTPVTVRVASMLLARRSRGGEGPFAALSKRRAQHIWDTAKAGTHLKDEKEAVIHALRHTCATRLLALTGDLKLVQEWLGHSTIDTTGDIYAKVMVGTKVSAVALLNAAAGNATIPQEGENHDRDSPMTGMYSAVTH